MGNQKLLKQIRAKDQDAVSRLYLKVKTPFVKYLKIYAGIETDEATEVYQEAFYILYCKIKDGRLTLMIPDLTNYLYGIGRNLVSNEYKRQKRIIRDSYDRANLLIDHFKDEREYLENSTKQEIVRMAVQALTEPCKSILNKFYFEKLSYYEMLTKMPAYTSVESLKAQKYKCMQRMSETIKGMFKIAGLD